MAKNKGLSAKELLSEAYNLLKKEPGSRTIKLPSEVRAEIANDSDGHRIRIGCTSYQEATLLTAGKKGWIIALGTACGSYPAEPYNCDIAAIPISSKSKSEKAIAEEICEALRENSYFRFSLIFAMADGQLMASKNSTHGKEVTELLLPKIREFIAQGLKVDSKFIVLSTLSPLVKSEVLYKKEFAEFLRDTFFAVLAA